MRLQTPSFRKPMEMGIWSPTRMTWIKPSKVWMAYRCGWTVLKDSNQARVLALDVDRIKFEELLERGTLSHGANGGKEKGRAAVVVQWDPERIIDPGEEKQVFTKSVQNVRSIQIGLRSPANKCLLDSDFVIRISDVTQDFRSALGAIEGRQAIDKVEAILWPGGHEQVMPVPPSVVANLQMTEISTEDEVPKTSKKQTVVVLGCTANPPHEGHLHCMRQAQKYSENVLGFEVLFSTIAVAPFGYVKTKTKKYNSKLLFGDEARLEILKLTASDISDKDQDFHFGYRQERMVALWNAGVP